MLSKQLLILVYVAIACTVHAVPTVSAQPSTESEATPAEQQPAQPASSPQSDESPLTDAELANVKALIKNLGDSNFQTRERASSQLIQFGPRLLDVLKESQKSTTSPEVSVRAKIIVDQIENDGQAERVSAFLKSPSDVLRHGFYGWEAFSEVAGHNRMARQVFVGLLPRYPQICNQNMTTEDLISFQASLLTKLQESRFNLDDEALTADTVVGQYLCIRLTDVATLELEKSVSHLVHMAPYSGELNRSGKLGTFRRITGSWMGTIKGDPTAPLLVSLDYNVPEGAQLARKTLRANPLGDSEYSLAMQTLLLFGTRDDLPLVEGFLNNDRIAGRHSVFLNGQAMESLQLFEDLALAVAVKIRKLNMNEYFQDAQPHPIRSYFSNSLIFRGPKADELRRAALEKYRAAAAKEDGNP